MEKYISRIYQFYISRPLCQVSDWLFLSKICCEMPSEHTQARCCAHIAPRGPVFHVRRSTDCNGFQMRINTLKLSGDPRAEGKTAEAMGRRTTKIVQRQTQQSEELAGTARAFRGFHIRSWGPFPGKCSRKSYNEWPQHIHSCSCNPRKTYSELSLHNPICDWFSSLLPRSQAGAMGYPIQHSRFPTTGQQDTEIPPRGRSWVGAGRSL